MRGVVGVLLIGLGIFAAVMGGYLLNAETVTTCETEWEYVTDVGGAFTGDRSDIDVAYDPSANVTGWSYRDAFNEGRISGVDFDTTTTTNAFRATVGNPEVVRSTMNVTTSDYGGGLGEKRFTASVIDGGVTQRIMPEGFGIRNPAAVTVVSGTGITREGSFGAPMSQLVQLMPGYSDLAVLTVTVDNPSGGYPCFGTFSKTVSVEPSTGGNRTVARFAALFHSDTIVIDLVGGSARLGSERVQLSDVFLVWGQAQYAGAGAHTDSATLTLSGEIAAPHAYVDAAKGVAPTAGTYTFTELQWVYHQGSSSPSFTLDLTNTPGPASPSRLVAADISVSIVFPGASTPVQACSAELVISEGDQASLIVTPTGGAAFTATSDDGAARLAMTLSGTDMAFTANGDPAGSYSVAYPAGTSEVWRIIVDVGQYRAIPVAFSHLTVGKDDGSSLEFSGDSAEEFDADLSYNTFTPVTTTEVYSSVYWYNGRSNASVTTAFTADAEARNTVVYRGAGGSRAVEVSYDPVSGWTAGGVPLGQWPAITVTAGYGRIAASPVTAFRTFLDFDVLDAPKEIGALFDGTITSMQVIASDGSELDLRMLVTSTVTRIDEGGLFLQNASMSLQDAFPGSDAVTVMIGSAARLGTSITFVGDSSASVPVDESRRAAYIGGKWVPLNGLAFRWYSSAGPSETISDTTYAPGIYAKGKTYAAGAIWAEPRGGHMTKIVDASTDWTMVLDGIWAPSVFLYDGKNAAAETTELADFTDAEYRWDSNQFIITMMAVSVIGGIAASYFRIADLWDWAAIIGTVGALWLIL